MEANTLNLYQNFIQAYFPNLDKKPKELYHYTSLDTLLGMINNQEIWMTHINFMNDKHEYRHALHIINEMTLDSLDSYKIKDIETRFDPFCSFSFSEDPNLLSQWRGYCSKNIGICLGFDPKILFTNNLSYLYKCVYDNDLKKEILQKITNISIQNCFSSKSQEETNSILKNNNSLTKIACATFKDKSFKEENEWRILDYANPETLQFRVGANTLIPYIKKELNILDSLLSIWIGPSSFQKETAYSLKCFLNTTCIEKSRIDNIIKLSDIPFIA